MHQNADTGTWLLQRYYAGSPLARDVIMGAERIGNLTSFFKTVDGAISIECTGRRRFSLREAVDLLRAPERQHDADVAMRHDRILSYRKLFESPASNPLVTIVEFSDDAVVFDGNHTGMAAYLHAANHPEPPYHLTVFILTVPESVTEID